MTCNEKWILYNNRQWPAQWLDWGEAPKHFPKPTLHHTRSWSRFGGLLPILSTRAFWIPAKPLHLRSMLSKLMTCTKNYNVYSRHWSMERAQFFIMTNPRTCCTANTSVVEQIELRSFASSTIFTCPVANWLPLLQASRQLFAWKTLLQTAEDSKCFPRVHGIPKHVFLCYRNNLFPIGKNALIVMVPILINKDILIDI